MNINEQWPVTEIIKQLNIALTNIPITSKTKEAIAIIKQSIEQLKTREEFRHIENFNFPI